MGKPLTEKNKLAYFDPERLPSRPDGVQRDPCSAGLLNDLKLFSGNSEPSMRGNSRVNPVWPQATRVKQNFLLTSQPIFLS